MRLLECATWNEPPLRFELLSRLKVVGGCLYRLDDAGGEHCSAGRRDGDPGIAEQAEQAERGPLLKRGVGSGELSTNRTED